MRIFCIGKVVDYTILKEGDTMKRTNIIHNSAVCFIQQEDINVLEHIKDFLGVDISSEASIISRECDENGFYLIEKPENVRVISSLNFIPDYDKFSNYSLDVLKQLAKKSQKDYMRFCELLNSIFDKKRPVDQESANFVRDLNVVDMSAFYMMVDEVFNATDTQALHFKEASLHFKEQMYHYMASIMVLARRIDEKQQSEQNRAQGNKSFVKRLFLKVKNGCNVH